MPQVEQAKKQTKESKPRTLTPDEVDGLIHRVRTGLREGRTERRREEPGLTDEARHFVIRY